MHLPHNLANYAFNGLSPFFFSRLPKTTPKPTSHSPMPICSNANPHLDQANSAAARLEAATDPSTPPQLHAHVLRCHLLLTSFHWNTLMRAYLRVGSPRAALRVYVAMSRAGFAPDSYSLPIAFKAASTTFDLGASRELHAAAVKRGLERNEYCESGLINVYSKAGQFDSARRMFDGNPERKLGSWNSLISGLAQNGQLMEAMEVFVELRSSGLVPDDVTMVSVVSACGGLGDIGLAKQIHKCVLQCRHFERLEVMVSNSLVDMYAKCGRTDLSRKLFDKMPNRDVSSWTSMITGLAMHGEERMAVELFNAMRKEGIRPNHVTMVGVLCACAHGGMVDQGMEYLEAMEKGDIWVEPTVAHYGCVVDMLGRVGRVEEAREVVERRMPMVANVVIWGTLLGACEKHANVVVGEWAAGKLVELEPWNDGVYVVLSNIYAGAEMWGEVERVRRLMRDRSVGKSPGFSSANVVM
ncbi:pentatricopeptide repeat-containing protein At1g77170, mitochondrial-like [Typha latifolia]|uniref:pentatricopeptide repeat-containing protein At1g77170, mitochondrial-like n=1 Tax=Typha latifolia TaxID=4733 RepID=UPI003C2C3C71